MGGAGRVPWWKETWQTQILWIFTLFSSPKRSLYFETMVRFSKSGKIVKEKADSLDIQACLRHITVRLKVYKVHKSREPRSRLPSHHPLPVLEGMYKSHFLSPFPKDCFVVVQSPISVWLFVTTCTAALQASLSLAISQSLPKFMSIVSVMPSSPNHPRRPLLLLPSIFQYRLLYPMLHFHSLLHFGFSIFHKNIYILIFECEKE